VRAVVLVVRFADLASEAGLSLGTNTDAVAYFADCDIFANFNHFSDNLVPDAEGRDLGVSILLD
jgi:hypothetical protein